MQAVIIGASGGVGEALTNALASNPKYDRVYALSRSDLEFQSSNIETGSIDILDETSVATAAERVSQKASPSLVIVASGILSEGECLQPERSYRSQTFESFERVFRVNTFGPAIVAKYFLPIMPRKERGVFAALSARVGSISDNRKGGWHAYRASKAALNMLIKNYAIEQARRNEEFIAVSLHPGTVDTNLSKPFQRNVPEAQLFSAEQSADYLLTVINGLEAADTGKAFDWAGKEIPA